ncbi:MAG TPA: hypothetical protein VL049_30380 [Candidatus Dormibacteraeota bacterium]|nr:hypothetical protein [Candidatus Dormibacteraeota bacterium]
MPNFRHRLTRAQQREYDRSNATNAIPVRVSPRLARAVFLLEWALSHEDRTRTAHVAQVICDELCAALKVRSLRVQVKAERPSDARGELHGLYESAGRREVISVWMLTAKRGQVVAYKTFLRTLVHEMGHHLDYQLLRLRDSFHTDGFFKRESSLVNQLLIAARRAAAAPPEPENDVAAAPRPSLSRRI